MILQLSKNQLKAVTRSYLDSLVSEKDVLDILSYITRVHRHSLDHTEIVRKYQKMVSREANLPYDYWRKN